MFGFERVNAKDEDLDLKSGTLYPGLSYGENQLRWSSMLELYGILSALFLLITIVSSVTALYSPVNELLRESSGLLEFLAILLPLILLWPVYVYHEKHPVNLLLVGAFFLSLNFSVGVNSAKGRIMLESLILTSAVVFSMTGYTFWAAKKGKDFSYMGPMLFASLFVLILAGFIQMFFPLGSTSVAIHSAICAVIFSCFIIYGTDKVIKRLICTIRAWLLSHLEGSKTTS